MTTYNVLEAKTNLSRLIEAVESGRESEIINGKPAARLVPIAEESAGPRIGIAKGLFEVPDDIDGANDEIARMFGVTDENVGR